MLYLMIHADYEGSDHCKKKNESPKKMNHQRSIYCLNIVNIVHSLVVHAYFKKIKER